MFYEDDDLHKPWPEVGLWRAVLLQLVEDATFTYKPTQRKNFRLMTDEQRQNSARARIAAADEAHRNRSVARAWLLSNSRDFREVCSLAQLDPEAVYDHAAKLARQGWPAPQKRRADTRYIVVETQDSESAA